MRLSMEILRERYHDVKREMFKIKLKREKEDLKKRGVLVGERDITRERERERELSKKSMKE